MKILSRLFRSITLLGLGLWGTSQAIAQDFTTTPDFLTNILLNDSLGGGLSPEAKRIIGRPFAPDMMVQTPEASQWMAYLNAPRVLDVASFSSFTIEVATTSSLLEEKYWPWWTTITKQLNERAKESKYYQLRKYWDIAQLTRERAMINQPQLIELSVNDLPEAIKPEEIQGKGYQGQLANTSAPQISVADNNIVVDQVARKYWWHNFEGSAQFAQNQVSENWHKGGYNSFNLNTRLYYNATYERDRLKWVNEIEYRLGLFTNNVGEEEKLQFKIGEDLFRAYTNLGVKAFDRWYYTVSAQLRSQALKNTDADGVIITRPFAPLSVDGGIGMKYELDLKNFRDNPFARLKFSANLAPIGMDFVYTYTDDIDKGRIGLTPDQKHRLRFGSSVRLDLDWNFSSALNWTSRLFYNTSYKHVEVEFDNTLSYTFNQFLSLRLTLNTRFDDSVILPEDKPKNFKNLLQYNQLLSVGFAYKI